MQQKGKAVLVDVREAKYFDKQHAENCLHVGLFRPVEGRTRLDNLKRLAMAGFAMEATGVASVCWHYLCPEWSLPSVLWHVCRALVLNMLMRASDPNSSHQV